MKFIWIKRFIGAIAPTDPDLYAHVAFSGKFRSVSNFGMTYKRQQVWYIACYISTTGVVGNFCDPLSGTVSINICLPRHNSYAIFILPQTTSGSFFVDYRVNIPVCATSIQRRTQHNTRRYAYTISAYTTRYSGVHNTIRGVHNTIRGVHNTICGVHNTIRGVHNTIQRRTQHDTRRTQHDTRRTQLDMRRTQHDTQLTQLPKPLKDMKTRIRGVRERINNKVLIILLLYLL